MKVKLSDDGLRFSGASFYVTKPYISRSYSNEQSGTIFRLFIPDCYIKRTRYWRLATAWWLFKMVLKLLFADRAEQEP